ncbi:MAG: hypothetical protein WEB31_02195 [Chthoniobacterales bacterium]
MKTITLIPVAALAVFATLDLQAAPPSPAAAQAALEKARTQAVAPVTAARDQATAPVTAARDQATAQAAAVRDQMKDKLKSPVKVPKLDVPNLAQAAKTSRAAVDAKVTSPRTLTYKSRASRISRWIAPLTFGLITYVPFDTMNADVTGSVNNLMAEEGISIEEMTAKSFAAQLKDGKRWSAAAPAEGTFQIEVNRYALDPVPTSVSRLRPTVSLTGRLFDNDGKLLWIGKGFTSSVEPGPKGASLEQYEANPDVLRQDFETAVQTATKRLAVQANAVPKASVKVAAAE